MRFRVLTLMISGAMAGASVMPATAQADNPPLVGNDRLNESVFSNILTAQAQNGCPVSTRFGPSVGNQPKLDPRLETAARRHTFDVRDRNINGSIGSDGSTPQDRARDAGFVGKVSETIAINPALSITGMEILHDFWYNAEHPEYREIMRDCSNTAIGIWSENSLARTVVVAVYGQPGTE